MRNSLRATAIPSQSKPVAERRSDLSPHLDTVLALLRTCVHDKGWTLEALAAEMSIDKSLISRVLNGERPLTLTFLLALPDEVEALFEARRAETFGLIVVEPASGDQAVRNLVSGLFGVLGASKLPARADRMARARLPLVASEEEL